MTARGLAVCSALALAIAVCGCSEQIREVSPTPQVLKQLGLPVYPHATLMRKGAQEMVMSSQFGKTISLIVSYQTYDDFEKVRQFYDERLPGTKRVISLPLGQVHTVTMQFTDKTGQKQVSIVTVKDMTLIQLQSTTLDFSQPGPTPTASASATPSGLRSF